MKKLVVVATSVLIMCVASSHWAFGVDQLDKNNSKHSIFELMNKEDKAIEITLKNGGKFVINKEKVLPRKFVQAPLNTSEETELYIWPATRIKSIAPLIKFTFTTGKNILVSYALDSRREPSLHPQSGKYKGLSKKSKSGISMRNNVTQKDIKPSSAKIFAEQWAPGINGAPPAQIPKGN